MSFFTPATKKAYTITVTERTGNLNASTLTLSWKNQSDAKDTFTSSVTFTYNSMDIKTVASYNNQITTENLSRFAKHITEIKNQHGANVITVFSENTLKEIKDGMCGLIVSMRHGENCLKTLKTQYPERPLDVVQHKSTVVLATNANSKS
jgi:hypothetical protein